ncbi:MAG: hypothetical protein ACJAY9_000775 [Flavobacteriales bacterium]|jgi:hypothetical protein
MYNYIRTAEIKKLIYVGEYGRIRVQFQDPDAPAIEEGVLIYETGDNACPAVGDQCMVFQIGKDYGLNYVMPYDIDKAPLIQEKEKIIYGNGNKVYLKADGSILIETGDSKNITVTTPQTDFSQDVNLGGVLKVGDTQVVGSQGATVVDATNLITAISQLNLLLAAVRTHGLIAS